MAPNDALVTSFKALANICARNLATYAILGDPITHINPAFWEPQFSKSSNLVQMLLQADQSSLPAQNGPPPMVELSRSDLDNLASLEEPARLIQWMQQMFEEKTGAEMIQATFWNLYKAAFSSYVIDNMLPATDLFRAVTSTYKQSKLVVVPEADDQPHKYLLCGLERRRMVQESTRPHGEGQTAFSPLTIALKRILDSVHSARYIKETLVPLTLTCIRDAQALGIQWPSQPLSGFASATIYRLVKEMGPRPTTPLTQAELAAFGCGCTQCIQLRQFIASSDQPMLSIRANGGVRKHISDEIEWRTRGWGFVCTIIKEGSPHVLQITKPEIFGAQKTWQDDKVLALSILAKLGTVDVQERVLGSRWEEVCKILEIPRSSAALTAAPSAPSTTQAKGGPSNQRARRAAARGRETPVAPQTRPQAAKRSFRQVIDAQASEPVAKRSKPVEIIERSDSG